MGKVLSFRVNNWVKYENEQATVVEDAEVVGQVIREYMNDINDDAELQLLEVCNLILEQKIDVDDSSYASFTIRRRFDYVIEIDSNDKWNKTNTSYVFQDKEQALDHEIFSSTINEIKNKINNGKRYEANTWELLKDNVRKTYDKWQPFKIIYNSVLEDSYFVPGAKDIYVGIVFINEQYEAKLLIRESACLGKQNLTEDELKLPENQDLFSDENFYLEEVFTTVHNKKTGKNVKFYDKHYHTIEKFISIKQKSIEAAIIKKKKKENKIEFGEYIKLFDDEE